MEKIVEFRVLDTKIYLITNAQELIDYFLYDEEYVPETIPGFKASMVDPDDRIDLTSAPSIEYIDSNIENIIVDESKNKLYLSCELSKLYKPDFVYYALCMFAKEFNKKNMYFVHCSIVEKNGEGTMLMGEAGSGKTTLALYLCTEYGYNFVCNDRALFGMKNGRPYVYASTLQTHIRVGVIEEFFPQFKSGLNMKLLEQPWKNKIYINPELDQLGVKIVEEASIKYIYLMYTYDAPNEYAYVDKYLESEKYDACLAIHEHISEYNRASRNIILTLGYPFPVFDNAELAMIRFKDCQEIVNNVKIADLRGTVKGAAELIFEGYSND